MDQFVVRTPRASPGPSFPPRSPQLVSSQTRIQDCSGVVDLKVFSRLHRVLQERERGGGGGRIGRIGVDEALEELGKKRPSSRLLLSSGILDSLRSLREDSPAAGRLYKEWKGLLQAREERKKNKIQVDFDLESQRIRHKSRDLMLKSVSTCLFSKRPKDQTLFPKQKETILQVEKEVFRFCDNKTTNKYRRLSRKIVFALKDTSVLTRLLKDQNPRDFLSSLLMDAV